MFRNRTDSYRECIRDFTHGNCDSSGFSAALQERAYLRSRSIMESKNQPHAIRHARFEARLLDNVTIEVNELELLVGRDALSVTLPDDAQQVIDKGNEIEKILSWGCGLDSNNTGHRVPDWEKLLAVGIRGLLEEIDDRLCALSEFTPEYWQKRTFYEASRISLEALVRFVRRWEVLLRQKAEATEDTERKRELLGMAENLKHAPYEPASHFHEAMQAMWIVQYALFVCNDTNLTGRIDQYLYPFFRRDVDSGLISAADAFELIEQLYYKHNEIYGSWPSPVMVGGVNRRGEPVWNELSEMCIRAVQTTKMVNPSVNVCYTPEIPDELMELCVDNIAKGYTRPAFFNDRVIQHGLRDAGMSEEDARYYINSTCVEITPIGSSNVSVATPYINLNKAIEYVLGGGKQLFGMNCHVERPIEITDADLADFDSFLNLVRRVISEIIRSHLTEICRFLYMHSQYASSPLASSITNDCLARGQDSGAGGARYTYIYPCFPGFINLIDSLSAIRKAVYEEHRITLTELAELCRTNFEGTEKTRLYLLNFCPKYANDDDRTNQLGVQLYEFIREELSHYHTDIGGTFHPSYFAWIMHGRLGKFCSALPDGRKQGEALSESLSAAQGRDKNGPLAVIRAISQIDQHTGIGGIATNFRFSKKFVASPEGRAALISFIRLFMQKDCFEVQFNIVDQSDLLDAQKHPENYRTLLVRVAGYSDYFVTLDPVIQDEIIKRTEHDEL